MSNQVSRVLPLTVAALFLIFLMPYPAVIGLVPWLMSNFVLAGLVGLIQRGNVRSSHDATARFLPVVLFFIWNLLLIFISANFGEGSQYVSILDVISVHNHLFLFIVFGLFSYLILPTFWYQMQVSKLGVVGLLFLAIVYMALEFLLFSGAMELTLLHVLIIISVSRLNWLLEERLVLIFLIAILLVFCDRSSSQLVYFGFVAFVLFGQVFASRVVFVALAVGIVGGYSIFVTSANTDVLSNLHANDYNSFIRIQMLRAALPLIENASDLFFGIGFLEPYRIMDFDIWSDHPLTNTDLVAEIPNHNSLFDIVLRSGLIGLVLFIAYPFWNAFIQGTNVQRFLFLVFLAELLINPWLEDANQTFLSAFIYVFLIARLPESERHAA